MITEDYVSFETAKLLKEKGFDEYCTHVYNIETGRNNVDISNALEADFYTSRYVYNSWLDKNEPRLMVAPTLQMAMKWLREKHNKIIIPGIRVTSPITGIIDCYYVGIYYIPKNNGGARSFISPTPENGYSSYEEACEAAIKYCLKNLI